ncbi:benzoate transporter [Rhodococcus sp. MS16]|uniref:benzoate/H(+) symporter BenE family transporter n=1 Tax=Rhodococcus sp. MS16 TaxID=2579941 RepID=UPI001561CC87|nr:benzoate/H(+) symporter BenE family transporter [Rhodococcus sp. MS16]NRI68332.1 benzoate transporter [Rhodococcus sp. MS16]
MSNTSTLAPTRVITEPLPQPLYSPRRVLRDFGGTYGANAVIGIVFSATGPVAVILAAGLAGGLSQSQLASWIFGAFFVNGILTITASWLYRQPLAFFWTIPGTVVVGASLHHLPWEQAIGAFFATGVLILLLGLTGWITPIMNALPMPIVMAMVAGVFLHFGTDLVEAPAHDAAIALPMIVTFVALSAFAKLGRYIPPVLGALIVGVVVVLATGRFAPTGGDHEWFAHPVLSTPAWSWQAMIELVVPLAITVVVVQNGQGIAVLRAAGHQPPIGSATIACGVFSLVNAAVGCVSTCLTGPTNALLSASGERTRQYTAGIFCGVLAVVFGLFAPTFVSMMLGTPAAFIVTLGGLAMLKALQGAFVTAFGSRFTFGALIAFLVTISDVELFNIGGAFWGLVVGVIASRILERSDYS